MNILWLVLISYGVSAALYSFRLSQKYFAFFEGQLGSGTIITQALGGGLIWPLTLLLDGVRGVWKEIAPLKVVAPEPQQPPQEFDPTQPLPGLTQLTQEAAMENLTATVNRNPW